MASPLSSPAPHRNYSIHDFVALEEYSNVRHEFLAGQIYAMAGGTPQHGAFAANVIGLLTAHLRGRRCRVHTSDVRVRVAATGLDTYPDVSVVCGEIELDADDRHAVTNPIVVVEILSEGTADYDRGEKLDHYKRIPSLREVMLVSHAERRIDVVRLGSDGKWSTETSGRGQSARLDSIQCTVPVDEVYRDPLSGD
jgi:Uma2 family endonuclease